MLAAAHAARPRDRVQTESWLEHRCSFDERSFAPRHFVAEADGVVTAYGALEGSAEAGSFRLFLVMAPALLPTVGELLWARLETAAREFGATALWAREYADDTALLDFLRPKGFAENARYHVPGVGELVTLAQSRESTRGKVDKTRPSAR